MRIGVMLRHLGQHGGGVLVYTQNLLRELLALGTEHDFTLLYRDPQLLGTYGNGGRVREIVVSAPSAFLWDQVAVPRLAKRERLDLVFNPKYSIPLAAPCRTVFVCHGLDWYVQPAWSRWSDRLSHRYLVPWYARRADKIIAVSHTAQRHVIEYLGVDAARVSTVYLGVDEAFRDPLPPERLAHVRDAYRLPERFFLYCGQIYPPKNFGRLLHAYARVGPSQGIALVAAGEHRWLCDGELALIDQLGLSEWVVRPGWIDRATLPAFYQLAEALVLPSLYEACPSPLLEAMASGCPIVTADRYGTKELGEGAAILVDPEDVASIAAGLRRVVHERSLREQLIARGRERVRRFSWRTCAKQTLSALEAAATTATA